MGEIGPVGGSVTPEPLRRGGWVGLGDSPQSAMVGQFSQITSLHFSQYDFNTDLWNRGSTELSAGENSAISTELSI